jgi:hypothetical protein
MAREPIADVRRARQAADRQLASVNKEGLIARLRQVHPAILIGASALAGVVLAGALSRRRVRDFAPLAALAGFVQSHLASTVLGSLKGWWQARVRREDAASAEPVVGDESESAS